MEQTIGEMGVGVASKYSPKDIDIHYNVVQIDKVYVETFPKNDKSVNRYLAWQLLYSDGSSMIFPESDYKVYIKDWVEV